MENESKKSKNDPTDWKAFFLGPQAENGEWASSVVTAIFNQWYKWRRSLFPQDGRDISAEEMKEAPFQKNADRCMELIQELDERFAAETPMFTPRYIGHMVSELSLPAVFGHLLALLHNPNNASKEVAKVGHAVEREAIAALAAMIGYDPQQAHGHFTSGGTIANLEGLWRARYRMDHWLSLGSYLALHHPGDSCGLFRSAHMGWTRFKAVKRHHGIHDEDFKPYSFVISGPWTAAERYRQAFGVDFKGPVVLVPRNKHYSWQKAVSVLGLGDEAFWSVDLDENGHLCPAHMEQLIRQAQRQDRPIMAVVSVAGTTELGEVDPVDQVQETLDRLAREEDLHIWHHVDAAYGGFYCSLLQEEGASGALPERVERALRALGRVDTITLDPHKLGYVPYACGALLTRDKRYDTVSSFEAPYLVRDKKDTATWSSTLEGSRAATGATAMWMSAHAIGLDPKGYGRILTKGIRARQRLASLMKERSSVFRIVEPGETNILCFCLARDGEPLSAANENTAAVFRDLSEGPDFSVSKTVLNVTNYRALFERFVGEWTHEVDEKELLLIRLVLMNPFLDSGGDQTDYLEMFVNETLALLPPSS